MYFLPSPDAFPFSPIPRPWLCQIRMALPVTELYALFLERRPEEKERVEQARLLEAKASSPRERRANIRFSLVLQSRLVDNIRKRGTRETDCAPDGLSDVHR